MAENKETWQTRTKADERQENSRRVSLEMTWARVRRKRGREAMTQEVMAQRGRRRLVGGRQAKGIVVVMWPEGCGGWLAFGTGLPHLLSVERRGMNNRVLEPLCYLQVVGLLEVTWFGVSRREKEEVLVGWRVAGDRSTDVSAKQHRSCFLLEVPKLF